LRCELLVTAAFGGTMLGLVVVGMMAGLLALSEALFFLLIGGGVGAILSRVYLLGWDQQKHEVVGRIDRIGAFILAGYVVFSLVRMQLNPMWGPDALESMASRFSLSAGIAVGRLGFSLAGISAVTSVLALRLDSRSEC
jgi:hypothetical protein